MNDSIRDLYTQMFAPQPIPQSVLDLYERTKHLSDRITAPVLPVYVLVLIAATATKSVKTSISDPIVPEALEKPKIEETLPPQLDFVATDVTPEPFQKPAEDDKTAQDYVPTPTGPMDAPAKPDPKKGMGRVRLMRLSAVELRVHAKEFYGIEAKKYWTKKKLVDLLHASRPIKPGARARHPSEVK
ncbi:MAG: hypothetical protein ACYS4W_14340 [Planctomycetota bacterium]|jgi:hypothetical protein